MIKICFKIVSAFWILSPIGFAIGWSFGVWRTHFDWLIGLGLVGASSIALFLNYDPE